MSQVILNPDADPESTSVDGVVRWTGPSTIWATARAATGTQATPSGTDERAANIINGSGSPNFKDWYRACFLFDASEISAGAIIDSAILELYVTTKFTAITVSTVVTSFSPDSDTDLITADRAIANFGAAALSDLISVSGMTSPAYNTWTINGDGLTVVSTAVDGDGIIKFGVLVDADRTNSPLSYVSDNSEGGFACQFADGANAPKLTINYTAPGGGAGLMSTIFT